MSGVLEYVGLVFPLSRDTRLKRGGGWEGGGRERVGKTKIKGSEGRGETKEGDEKMRMGLTTDLCDYIRKY